MKKRIIYGVCFLFLAAPLLQSCEKTETPEIVKEDTEVPVLPPVVTPPDNTGKIIDFESAKMPAIFASIRKELYLGAIIKGDAASDLTNFKPVVFTEAERNPITIYATFPTDDIFREIAAPGPGADNEYLRSVLKSGSTQQIASFSFNVNQFKRYEELKLSLGADISITSLFKLPGKDDDALSAGKTRVRVEFTQENFSINMEPPIYLPFLKSTADLSKLGNTPALIVSSIVYGRKGILVVESDADYAAISEAIKATIALPLSVLKSITSSTTTVSGLTTAQLQLLNSATISTYLIGTGGDDLLKTVQGLPGFAQLLAVGGEYSAQSPGVPLFYMLNSLNDFGTHYNKFQVKIYNK